MNKETFHLIEDYMISCAGDSAHDKEHIYRVLYNALSIAKKEKDVDHDVLIGACLLHDIGRKEQYENPELCHAKVGSEKAYRFLIEHGFGSQYAEKVKLCIQTHRFRKNDLPASTEAKILFDADKLDVAGAIGIARTLLYQGAMSEPLYSLLPDGNVSNGENDTAASFFQEYKFKLEKIYSNFFTDEGKRIALERQNAAITFFNHLYDEVKTSYENGKSELKNLIK